MAYSNENVIDVATVDDSDVSASIDDLAVPVPQADKKAILSALKLMLRTEDVVELRALYKGSKKRIDSGYFDSAHWPQLADEAHRLSRNGAAVYITLNPVEPQLIARHYNRVEAFVTQTTSDKQITRRRWILVDLDPVRPPGVSASHTQVLAASSVAKDVSRYLKGLGWPTPSIAMSGNGVHLLYAIDLSNDDVSRDLVANALKSLGSKFDTADVKVDRTVCNAARIIKLYGTVANKGDHTPAAPWRLSQVIRVSNWVPVAENQLRELVGSMQVAIRPPAPNSGVLSHLLGAFNLDDFLSRHSLEFKLDQHDGRERFKLAACPFNPEHVNGESAIFRKPSGELGFKCMHDSCAEKRWRDVRTLLDGPRPAGVSVVSVGGVDATNPNLWSKPIPLPSGLPPVAPFAEDLLPVAIGEWVKDIAHRMQCPTDFPAVGALVALSSLIGARAVVQPKMRDDWRVVPNLWGMTVGRPGVKKSPALSEVLKPMGALQATAYGDFEQAHDKWEVDRKLADFQDAENEKKAKKSIATNPSAARQFLNPTPVPEEPRLRRYIVNDATVEKLGELMQENPWGTLSYRDELYGLLTSLDKQGQEGSRAFYLQSYDGNQGYTFDRIMRGTVHISRVCLAMIGGIQPGRIQEYVRGAVSGGSGDDGLLQRFGLAVWPDHASAYVHVDELPNAPARERAFAVFQRLAGLQPVGETEPAVWRFSPAAQEIFSKWIVPFENELRGDTLHPAMVSHLAKYRKLIPALALIFALVDTPESDGQIHEAELSRALAWGRYLRTHANRLYSAALAPETTNAGTLLAKITAHNRTSPDGIPMSNFTPRLIAQKSWAGLTDTDAVRKAAELLVDYGWLRRELIPSMDERGRGRASEIYVVHPDLL